MSRNSLHTANPATLETNLAQKVKHRELPHDSAMLLLGIQPREMTIYPRKTLYTNVHTSTVLNGQKVKTIQISIN